MSKDHDPQSRNHMVPRLEALEDRVLLSEFPFLELPRTGGAAVQVGSTLEVAVAPPLVPGFGLSTTLIQDEGGGNVAVEWNGLPPQFFSGIDTITLNAGAPGNLALFLSLTPRTSPALVATQMTGVLNAFVGLVSPLSAPPAINFQTPPTFFEVL